MEQQLLAPKGKMRVIARYVNSKRPDLEFNEQYSGGVVVADQAQVEALKQLLGDSNASVSVGLEMSESDYGTGLKVFCSVTLTCDQSQAAVDQAGKWAAGLAYTQMEAHFNNLKSQLVAKGLLKPPAQSGSPFGQTR